MSLRVLYISKMKNLVSVTLSGGRGILDALECVVLRKLKSLVHGSIVRRWTSLDIYHLWNYPLMESMDGIECPNLKELGFF